MKEYFSALMVFGVFSSVAFAQGVETPPTLRFEAIRNSETGLVELRPADDFTKGQFPFESPTGAMTGVLGGTAMGSGAYTADDKAYVLLDNDNAVLQVFAPPKNPVEQKQILDSIDMSGKVVTASFWGNRPSLPTIEETRTITRAALQEAMDFVCSSNPLPEDTSVEVELAVSLALEGRFTLSSSWKPARDCRQQ